jgi:hypothetical protein
LWFALFDAAAGVSASKVELPDPGTGTDHYIHMGDARFEPARVVGAAPSLTLDAAWDLEFEGSEAPLLHLPARWMYRARFPRTKVLTPHPRVVFRGHVTAADRDITVDGWPGVIGHIWGAEHAQRAIWIHGTNFTGHEDAWLDMAIGRIRLGALTTPWIANGVLCLDGVRHRLGGLARLRATNIDEAPERCRFHLVGDQVTVEGVVGARPELFVSWLYAQPQGGERQTVNCSIADMRLEVTRGDDPPLVLSVTGGAAYELQMSERYDRIPVQPFPAG